MAKRSMKFLNDSRCDKKSRKARTFDPPMNDLRANIIPIRPRVPSNKTPLQLRPRDNKQTSKTAKIPAADPFRRALL
jgi:hypothetical protein